MKTVYKYIHMYRSANPSHVWNTAAMRVFTSFGPPPHGTLTIGGLLLANMSEMLLMTPCLSITLKFNRKIRGSDGRDSGLSCILNTSVTHPGRPSRPLPQNSYRNVLGCVELHTYRIGPNLRIASATISSYALLSSWRLGTGSGASGGSPRFWSVGIAAMARSGRCALAIGYTQLPAF